jgi:uncharacterized coiled-coil protein SlyX
VRKSILYSLIALIVVLGGASGMLYAKYQKASQDFAEMKTAEAAAQARYTETIDAIAGIQDSLNAITVGDPSVPMISRDLAVEQQLGQPAGQQALDRIAMLRAVVLRSKERIQTLEAGLKKSGNRIAGLQRMIANLKQSVTEKEGVIDQLTLRVDSLNTQVADLATEVQVGQETIHARELTIEEKRSELATVYVAVGSKKELRQKGVIESRGGVLGLGKTLRPSPLASTESFTPIDTDQETVVRTTAAKAKVVSSQPASSYDLRLVDGHIELHIVDPREFRKVRQLVVVTS